MNSKTVIVCGLGVLLCVSVLGAVVHAQASGATQSAAEVRGTWSGTFYSKHSNVVPFAITLAIIPDARGRLVGTSSLSSDCLKGAKLQVTVTGPKIVLAGSDDEGDNITVHGTLDASGSLLHSTYILNGSATGKCETDDGSGELVKR